MASLPPSSVLCDCHYPVLFVLARSMPPSPFIKQYHAVRRENAAPRAPPDPVARALMAPIRSYNQKVKKSMTPTKPALMPAISLLGAAGLSVDVGDGGATWPPLLLPVAEGTVE